MIKSEKKVKVDNENAISHMFLRKGKAFNAQSALPESECPKMPTSAELVNQTVSVSKEPIKAEYQWRNVVEFRKMNS